MLHPAIFNTAQVCHQLGVKHAVMSPGSRNAPLTISFARHDDIEKWIVPDERSAGFIALGIAQETETPVVLCCTSGTALLNYAPAIAEAYYREIPLIVLSADRPPELIDQRDGQTIRQFEVLKNHVKQSVQLPLVGDQKNADQYTKDLIETLRESMALPVGPVHINMPFAEPFYPSKTEKHEFQNVQFEEQEAHNRSAPTLDLSKYSKVLVLLGQHAKDSSLSDALERLSTSVPVIRFPLNNLSGGIEHVDQFISNEEELRPDLLITSGLSVLSKQMKMFLRANGPLQHIHLDQAGVSVDTYKSNPEIIRSSLLDFLNENDLSRSDLSYLNLWKDYEEKTRQSLTDFINKAEFSELLTAKVVLALLPEDSKLHLSNSMPVRYADIFGVPARVECFSNRGTSGIDGCTSTAFGTSLVSDKLNILVTGDLAFLYDRNAFFNNYNVPNFRIIILNNQGGGIFRLIEGPSNLPELEDYFETRHNRTAEYICAENNLEYRTANDLESLNDCLTDFFRPSGKAKVLEVFTDPTTNQKVYRELKEYINECIKH